MKIGLLNSSLGRSSDFPASVERSSNTTNSSHAVWVSMSGSLHRAPPLTALMQAAGEEGIHIRECVIEEEEEDRMEGWRVR